MSYVSSSNSSSSSSNLTNPSKSSVLPQSSDDVFASYVKKISRIKPLTQAEELRVAKEASEGSLVAKQKLVSSNLKLVITLARKSIHNAKIPVTDLIQEGNLGLMIAAEKFNYKLGYKFSTYAAWWIKQSMFKAISEQAYCMKIPVYVQETLSKFSKVKSEMEQKYNCAIKNSQVAEKMNVKPNKIDEYLSAYTQSVSLDATFKLLNGNEVSLDDILVDERVNTSEEIEFETLKSDIYYVVSKLKERERDVVKMRYGLGELKRRTLEEIGNIYGVTKECIRQTELRAIKKLKGYVQSEGLLVGYIH